MVEKLFGSIEPVVPYIIIYMYMYIRWCWFNLYQNYCNFLSSLPLLKLIEQFVMLKSWRVKIYIVGVKVPKKKHATCRIVVKLHDSDNRAVLSHMSQTCYFVGEFYQQQAISPVASRENRMYMYSAVTGVTGYSP